MNVKQARAIKVGDAVTWREEMQFTTQTALEGSVGVVIDKVPCGFTVKWGDGLVVQYMNIHSTHIQKLKVAAAAA